MEEKLPFEKVNREILVKKEGKTNPEFGNKPDERSVEQLIQYGVINLNKPAGPTSHQVSDYVQKILDIKKAGHSGTLDPNVIGVLPIALAKATRIVQALLKSGKEYVCLMHLHKEVNEKKIHEVIKEFQGRIKQLPPVRSAVKRQERFREVYYLNILETKGKDVLFKIGCEAGTYIRKICHDLGKRLEIGAHMFELIRTKAGPFTDKDWHSLQDLKDAYEFYKEGNEKDIRDIILPFEKAVDHLQKIWVFDNAVNNLCHGASLAIPGISKLYSGINEKDTVAIMTLKNELIALGTSQLTSEETIKSEKGIAVKIEKVFMPRNTYK